MPFSFYLEPVMDQQNIASLFYGPVLLAAQESEPRTEWRKVTLDAKDISKKTCPPGRVKGRFLPAGFDGITRPDLLHR